jgi:hypothetical protein
VIPPTLLARGDRRLLAQVRQLAPSTEPGKRGRLIFALDATMSRQPTWDTACRLADMFQAIDRRP